MQRFILKNIYKNTVFLTGRSLWKDGIYVCKYTYIYIKIALLAQALSMAAFAFFIPPFRKEQPVV